MNKSIFTIQLIGSVEDNENIRLSDFIQELTSIKETLIEIDRRITRTTKPSTDFRIIDLSRASPSCIVLEAIPIEPEIDNTSIVIDKFISGLQSITKGFAPKDFDSPLLEQFEKIGKGLRRKLKEVKFLYKDLSVIIGKTFEGQILKLIGESQFVDGSIEGTLEMINIHKKVNKFRIYPIVGPKKVNCHFPESLYNDVIKAIGHYINVKGKLEYKERDDFPYTVNVDSIEIYPDENELPTIFDLRGIAPNATGSLSSEEFVRKLRDAN